MGHEGQGSLLSALKERGWCNTLVAGARSPARGFAFFNVTVDLTIEGLDHVDEIITLLFQVNFKAFHHRELSRCESRIATFSR